MTNCEVPCILDFLFIPCLYGVLSLFSLGKKIYAALWHMKQPFPKCHTLEEETISIFSRSHFTLDDNQEICNETEKINWHFWFLSQGDTALEKSNDRKLTHNIPNNLSESYWIKYVDWDLVLDRIRYCNFIWFLTWLAYDILDIFTCANKLI